MYKVEHIIAIKCVFRLCTLSTWSFFNLLFSVDIEKRIYYFFEKHKMTLDKIRKDGHNISK